MARDFNGNTANFLQIGDVAAIDLTGTDITVSCWVYFDTVAAAVGLVTKYGNTAGTRQYALELTAAAKADFITNNGAGGQAAAVGATTVTAGRWHHICGVQNSTDAFVYLNGTQDGTDANQQTMVNTSAVLDFGKYSVNGFPLDGRMQDVAIWATPLSGGEVASLAAGAIPTSIQASLIRGYWPLCGLFDPEPDLVSGNGASVNGTVPAASHFGGVVGSPCVQGQMQSWRPIGTGGLW